MGNQASQLGDEPFGVNRELQHFDHTFKGELHTCKGPDVDVVFGECKYENRPIELNCKGSSLEVIEERGLAEKSHMDVSYGHITAIGWDHSGSEVKIDFRKGHGAPENSFIFTMANSIELEFEFKLRFTALVAQVPGAKAPATSYVGMFAGSTKPKPFQRKRPNLSRLPSGKLPPLNEMRNTAIQLNKGSYKPCPSGESRRLELAIQHIHEGYNTFSCLRVRGPSNISGQWRPEAVLQVKEEMIVLKPYGPMASASIEFVYEDVEDWEIEDNDHIRPHDSALVLHLANGETISFFVPYVRDVKHTVEYFWNHYRVENNMEVKLGSTHGRPLVTVQTLSGEMAATEAPVGSPEVVDQDGITVRPGARIFDRNKTLMGKNKEPKIVPAEIPSVKKHWHKLVMHQGWLLKKGGVGIGAAKNWLKRYFVLYSTSQGHFMMYYGDCTECPLYSNDRSFRNVVDLSKATFIRPGSNKADFPDTPPHSFDIVTTERDWTLCAESQENVQKWLKLIMRAVDEDVAILPDEELVFKVKPKVDPMGILPATDYSTSLRISSHGVSVCTPDMSATGASTNRRASVNLSGGGAEREHYFWVYTDFYKWSLLSQAGKLALLVNVFADASFSRRNEYIFRNKEAVRLATAIEYFIEKFMSVMHLRLEALPGAFDEVPESTGQGAPDSPKEKSFSPGAGGMHNADISEYEQQEVDLLGFDDDRESMAKSAQSPFGDDPFGGGSGMRGQQTGQSYGSTVTPNGNTSNGVDLFGDDGFGADVAAKPSTNPAASSDLFGDDGFGGPAAPAGGDGFGDDPFAADPFGAPKAAPAVKTAPPLTQQQIMQHTMWLKTAMTKNGGPLYDDGSLQVATAIEVRGSQSRVTFFMRNQSPSTMTDFKCTVSDPAGLVRYELSPGQPTLGALSQAQQQLMAECMKPAYPGPELSVSYTDSLLGMRSNTVQLPLTIFTFNEPLQLSGPDFANRWEQLTGPGLQGQEVFNPSSAVVPSEISSALSMALKFGAVIGVPGESEFVIHGASSLRTGALTPTGEKINIGCLVKIEMNVQSNAIRVTARTLHPAATTAVMASAKALLV
jgi:hypothetical protein